MRIEEPTRTERTERPERRRLGRGLGALIPSGPRDVDGPSPMDVYFEPTAPVEPPVGVDPVVSPDLVEVVGVTFREIPIQAIRANPRQPRQVFDEDEHAELVASITEIGLLQPVVVRPLGSADPVGFELVVGERRWRACRDAGLQLIPAIVRETDDDAMLRDALLENLHRSQLNPLEEAAAYQQLMNDFDCTQDELAERVRRSRPQVSNTLRLLRLPPLVQRRVAAGVLSAGHARALLGVSDPLEQELLAQRVVAEGLSVRAVEELVSLGTTTRPARRPRSRAEVPGEVSALVRALGDRLDTRVCVDLGKRKGRMTIEFAGIDDLRRIIATMDRLPRPE